MRRTLTSDDEFGAQLRAAEHSLWRWEQQPAYHVEGEAQLLEEFGRGHRLPATAAPLLRAWLRQVAQQSAAGITVGRVRVLDRPTTSYQRWLMWIDRWNRAAGEEIEHLTRTEMVSLGPQPFGAADWWLVDDRRVLLMPFDETGRRGDVELLDDETSVTAAVLWRRRVLPVARRHAEGRPA